jgi:hypothetical protein
MALTAVRGPRLYGNKIGDAGAVALASNLRGYLSLEGLTYGPPLFAFLVLAALLTHARVFSLRTNKIGDEGAKALLDAANQCPALDVITYAVRSFLCVCRATVVLTYHSARLTPLASLTTSAARP